LTQFASAAFPYSSR